MQLVVPSALYGVLYNTMYRVLYEVLYKLLYRMLYTDDCISGIIIYSNMCALLPSTTGECHADTSG